MDQYFEDLARSKGFRYPIGIDEVGRGPLAGPVVAAACSLTAGFSLDTIRDSKQLGEKQRSEVFDILSTSRDVHYGIGVVDHETIDIINILQASLLAMQKAYTALTSKWVGDFAWVDGNQLPWLPIPVHGLIQGDARCMSVAAASIIAKVTRDRIVAEYDSKWPQFQFASHKGYATKHHLEMLSQHGPLPVHRRSFKPVRDV